MWLWLVCWNLSEVHFKSWVSQWYPRNHIPANRSHVIREAWSMDMILLNTLPGTGYSFLLSIHSDEDLVSRQYVKRIPAKAKDSQTSKVPCKTCTFSNLILCCWASQQPYSCHCKQHANWLDRHPFQFSSGNWSKVLPSDLNITNQWICCSLSQWNTLPLRVRVANSLLEMF